MRPNHRVESSRHCISPSVLTLNLGSGFRAPPALAPAVALSKPNSQLI